jgi:hypothetical protein
MIFFFVLIFSEILTQLLKQKITQPQKTKSASGGQEHTLPHEISIDLTF